ncbi:MAG TPA: hypothetical protein VGM06_10020 [Polyangiaceae bacterium]|jgi:hypothetical protein
MPVDADVRAFDALIQHPRLADLTAIARSQMTAAAQTRRLERRADQVAKLAREMGLSHDEALTPFGNALDVLARGPEGEAERALASGLAGHVLAMYPPKGPDDESRFASDLLWLADHTHFDATGLVDHALGDAAAPIWDAIADRVRRIDEGGLPGRGEALIGAAALAASSAPVAARRAAALAAEARDRKLARVLRGGGPGSAKETAIACEMAPAPRGAVATTLLALSGVLLAMHAARLFGRFALAYKRPAEIALTQDGGDPALRVRWRVEMLGRTLRDRSVMIPRAGLLRAAREVRYPRPALHAGLLSLAIGSYLGLSTFVDGVRGASPSLLASGVGIVALGLALDFLLSTLWPGVRGRCRVVFVPRGGAPLCVGNITADRADAVLAVLARPRG